MGGEILLYASLTTLLIDALPLSEGIGEILLKELSAFVTLLMIGW